MVLRLEHVEEVRAERLRGLDDIGTSRVRLSGRLERRGCAVDGDAGADQGVDELRRRQEVGLIRRKNVSARIAQRGIRHRPGDAVRRGGPPVAAALLDRVPPHPVDVGEPRLPMARGGVEDGAVGRDGVLDGPPEPHAAWRGVSGGLQQEPNLIVEIGRRPETAVPPGRVRRTAAGEHAVLLFHREPAVQRRAREREAEGDERIEAVVRRLAVRRDIHDRAAQIRLMVIDDDLRHPLAVQDAAHVDRLGLRPHVEIAVVVVARVLLIEARQVRQRSLARIGLAHVPVGDELVAVGIGVHGEHDHVAQDPLGFGIIRTDEVVDGLDQLLRRQHLGGVQATADPHHGLPLDRQHARLFVSQSLGRREAL